MCVCVCARAEWHRVQWALGWRDWERALGWERVLGWRDWERARWVRVLVARQGEAAVVGHVLR